ncbi:MAG: type II toxin-antitoxin system Phd/YefM family antitoxin [Acidimicrobiales bacterium]
MREIGSRELRQSLAAVLDAVGRGDHFRVTTRGRAVADIIPIAGPQIDERLHRLASEGRVTLPTRSRPARSPRLARSEQSAASIVLAERESEN